MPFKDPEKRKEYDRQYQQKNKEKLKEYKRQWQIQYSQTPQGKKLMRIKNWRRAGIISNDYNALYERYLNTTKCEECNCVLTVDRYTTKTTRCLDHDHSITDRENVRNILCNSCNVKRR